MTIDLSKLDLLIGVATNGVFTGIGVTMGAYFAKNHIIKKIKKIKKRVSEWI